MKYYECKHVDVSVDYTGKKTSAELRQLMEEVQARGGMQLYRVLAPEERETIVYIEHEPQAGGAAYRGTFYADPDVSEGTRGLWKELFDKIAAGNHSRCDANGEPRETTA